MTDEERRTQLTPTQQAILSNKEEHPNWSDGMIADEIGCSRSHVTETLQRWDPEDVRDDGTAPARELRDGKAPLGVGFWIVVGGIVAWVGAVVGTFPLGGAVADSVLTVLWVAALLAVGLFPVGIFLDARSLHEANASWRPNTVVWPMVGLAVVLLGPILYLLVRFVKNR